MTDTYAGGEPLVQVVRSGFVESRHHGSVVVLDATGDVAALRGDIVNPIFPRSSNKPFQAVGLLRAGFRPASTAALALAAASHYGEPVHLAGVRAMLADGGFTEHDLGLPADSPLADPGGSRRKVHHNCSGKHAAMLLACRANGWPTAKYLDPEHPLQRSLLVSAEDQAGPVAATGVDGCGAPVWAMPLVALARAMQNLVEAPVGSRRRAVADAMRAHPDLVAGTGPRCYDTHLMRAHPGLLSKGGAEGVEALAVPGVGAIAVKIDDGGQRALVPVVLQCLRLLGVEVSVPAEPVLGGGRVVGEIRASI